MTWIDPSQEANIQRTKARLVKAEAELNTLRVNSARSGVYWQERALRAEAENERLRLRDPITH